MFEIWWIALVLGIITLGLFGNVMIIAATLRKNSTLHSKSNYLIATLTISDLTCCVGILQVKTTKRHSQSIRLDVYPTRTAG